MQFLLGERLIPPKKVSFLIFSKNVWPQDRFSGQNGRYLLCSEVRQYDTDTGEKSRTHGKGPHIGNHTPGGSGNVSTSAIPL